MIENNNQDIENQRIEEIKALIVKGEDINKSLKDGKTFLEVAIQNKHNKLSKFLLNNSADVNAVNKKQRTPFVLAMQSNNI